MTIEAFKGFNRDLTCRGFQYKVGETYEQDAPAQVCSTGFHAVTLPLDALSYYKPGPDSVYHRVTLDDVAERSSGDSKVAGRKITIGASVDVPGLVKAHVEAVFDLVKKPSKAHAATTGRYAHAATTGDSANAATTGRSANVRASVKDEGSIAAVLGQGAASGAVGCWLVLTERDGNLNILGVQAVQVDGDTIKADTFYELRDGQIVEVTA